MPIQNRLEELLLGKIIFEAVSMQSYFPIPIEITSDFKLESTDLIEFSKGHKTNIDGLSLNEFEFEFMIEGIGYTQDSIPAYKLSKKYIEDNIDQEELNEHPNAYDRFMDIISSDEVPENEWPEEDRKFLTACLVESPGSYVVRRPDGSLSVIEPILSSFDIDNT